VPTRVNGTSEVAGRGPGCLLTAGWPGPITSIMWSQKHCRVLLAARSIAPIAEALVRSRELTHLLVSCDRSLVPEKAIPHGFRPPLGKHSDLRAELFPGEPITVAGTLQSRWRRCIGGRRSWRWWRSARRAGSPSGVVPARHQCRRGISAGAASVPGARSAGGSLRGAVSRA
jgi:hypothetical protein